MVYIPELVVGHWWERPLHNQTALFIKARLAFLPGVITTAVPYPSASSQHALDKAVRTEQPRRGGVRAPAPSTPGSTSMSEPVVPAGADWRVGDVLRGVRIGRAAAGGHWVARHEGRVVFVRHALEGELADVRLTGLAPRHAFADAQAIADPSPHRVAPPCPVAARRCGGCDAQHVEAGRQREIKRQVVAEQLHGIAGLDWRGEVEPVAPAPLGWRRRMRYRRDGEEWGLRAKASPSWSRCPARAA